LLAASLVIRQESSQQPPKLVGVILELEVADLVRHDVIHKRQRSHDDTPVQAEVAAVRAAAPPLLLLADVDGWRGVAEPFGEQGDALGGIKVSGTDPICFVDF
jgi:hypothetical protein